MHSIQVVIAQLMLGLMVFCNAEEAVFVDFDKKFWVCEAGDPKFLGEYITEEENAREGAQVWTNKHDMSIFRNSGVWYMGNLETWPPETHYRCDNMEGCEYAEPEPAVPGQFSVNPRYGKDPAPSLSATPCGQSNDEL